MTAAATTALQIESLQADFSMMCSFALMGGRRTTRSSQPLQRRDDVGLVLIHQDDRRTAVEIRALLHRRRRSGKYREARSSWVSSIVIAVVLLVVPFTL